MILTNICFIHKTTKTKSNNSLQLHPGNIKKWWLNGTQIVQPTASWFYFIYLYRYCIYLLTSLNSDCLLSTQITDRITGSTKFKQYIHVTFRCPCYCTGGAGRGEDVDTWQTPTTQLSCLSLFLWTLVASLKRTYSQKSLIFSSVSLFI